MKQDFKKLKEQALQQVADKRTGGDISRLNTESYHVQDLLDQKFAELIVGICAKVCANTAVVEPPNDLFYGYNMGVNKAAENILEHFGVKE